MDGLTDDPSLPAQNFRGSVTLKSSFICSTVRPRCTAHSLRLTTGIRILSEVLSQRMLRKSSLASRPSHSAFLLNYFFLPILKFLNLSVVIDLEKRPAKLANAGLSFEFWVFSFFSIQNNFNMKASSCFEVRRSERRSVPQVSSA